MFLADIGHLRDEYRGNWAGKIVGKTPLWIIFIRVNK
jgi:hypothetical protein